MNNAKMWLVVKPTVGIPMFLGAVAIGSFAVHVSVLSSTGWVSDFLKGAHSGVAAVDTKTTAANVVFKGEVGSAQEAVITLPDGRTARVVFDAPGSTSTAMVDASLAQ